MLFCLTVGSIPTTILDKEGVVMAKNSVAKRGDVKAKLGVYYDYDLTGGGPPFGHVRTFHVELTLGGKTIVRNASAGEKLKRMVEKHGKPSGEKESLPYDRDYSSRSYEQWFVLTPSFTAKRIEAEIPFESVL